MSDTCTNVIDVIDVLLTNLRDGKVMTCHQCSCTEHPHERSDVGVQFRVHEGQLERKDNEAGSSWRPVKMLSESWESEKWWRTRGWDDHGFRVASGE
jgi:hypothetical protein